MSENETAESKYAINRSKMLELRQFPGQFMSTSILCCW